MSIKETLILYKEGEINMTSDEKKLFTEMKDMLRELRQSNAAYTEALNKRVDDIESIVKKKHLPVNLEADILSTAQAAVGKAISDSLTGYNSPLVKLATAVVEENSHELKAMINDSFTKVIHTDEFKQSIIDAFTHKIGRLLIDKSSGLLEKTVNDLRQDAVLKSRLALAVNNVVEEYLKEQGLAK